MSETMKSGSLEFRQPPAIYGALAKVMADVGAVGKSKKNAQQGYQFRGVDDVVAHVQDVMATHGVVCVPRVVEREREMVSTKSGGSMASVRLLVEHTFFAVDGSSVSCVTLGEAMDSGDKASNKAMSAALKYALTETLLIPTYEVDRDTEEQSPQLAPKTSGLSAGVASRANGSASSPTPPSSPPSNVTPLGPTLEVQVAEWAAKFAQCATVAELEAAGKELAKSRNDALKAAVRGAYNMRHATMTRAVRT